MFEEDESGRRRVDAGEKAAGTTAEASKSEFVMGPSAKSTLGKIVNAFGERLDGEKMVTGTEDSSRMIVNRQAWRIESPSRRRRDRDQGCGFIGADRSRSVHVSEW